MLNIQEKTVFDESIANAEYRSHAPYSAAALNQNDEIRIPIQHQDVCTLPSASMLYIEGKLVKIDGKELPATVKFVNNGILFLFDEIWYEIGGATVDKVRNPGLTTIMKGLASYGSNESRRLQNAGWTPTHDDVKIADDNGNFSVCIPLKMIMGFAEDFRKVVLNVRQELVLRRSNTDSNAIFGTDAAGVKVQLTKVLWKMPHIVAGDVERLKLLNIIEKKMDLDMPFRSWELHEQPLLQETQRQSWSIKTTTQLETPRYVIVGFQTDRKNNVLKDMSKFDHCHLENIKLYLNSEMYPYDNLNLNFDNNQFALLYEMYADFQKSYYETKSEPVLTPIDFKNFAPLCIIDCSKQKETTKRGSVDLRLEFETSKIIPGATACYCLILHDRLVKYNPFSSKVQVL
jgi:hypothetical protein